MKKLITSFLTVAIFALFSPGVALGRQQPLATKNALQSATSYWPLNGNSNDAKGSNNGTDTSVAYGPQYGKFGQGVLYNGSNSTISMGNPASLQLTGNFTICTWVNFVSIPTGQYASLMEYGATVSTYPYYGIVEGYDSAGSGHISLFSGTGGNTYFTGTTVLAAGKWYFVCGVLSGTGSNQAAIYVNGILDTQGTLGNPSASTGNFYLGSWRAAAGYWNGDQDDTFVFPVALSSTTIADLYTPRSLEGSGISR
ncbi:hypothetical protein M1506_02100 [Patescibacteria group bacterium]|nr:hypothetical protein [Patescibacteria group bacterium]